MITERQEKRLQRQRDKEMRRRRRRMAAFKASPHHDIVKADFAQLEARQAARNHNIVPIAALITLRLNHD